MSKDTDFNKTSLSTLNIRRIKSVNRLLVKFFSPEIFSIHTMGPSPWGKSSKFIFSKRGSQGACKTTFVFFGPTRWRSKSLLSQIISPNH